jgi:RHS repeat-associated protein
VVSGTTFNASMRLCTIEERLSNGQTLDYVQGASIDQPLAQRDQASVATYYLADHLGSIAQQTNSGGAVTLTREYDPWGNLLQGSTTGGYAFTGREWDPETQLYYYRARYYDPKIGRFASGDPIGDPQVYAYASNNPVFWGDPMGTSPGGVCYDVTIKTVTKCNIDVLSADDAGGKGCPFLVSHGGGKLCKGLTAAAQTEPLHFGQGCSGGCCKKTEQFSGPSSTLTQEIVFYIYSTGGDYQAETGNPVPGSSRCKLRVKATITGMIDGYRGTCQDKCE